MTYMRPIPMTINVAPTLPMIRYWKDAVSARRSLPSAIKAYAEREEISRKTKTLNTSPVTAIPSRPVRQRMKAA